MSIPIEILPLSPLLFIMPPFGPLDRSSIGLHTLEAVARANGVETGVLYANIHFASCLGETAYNNLANTPISMLAGERMFARAAFRTPPLGHDHGAALGSEVAQIRESLARSGLDASRVRYDPDLLIRMEETACVWVNEMATQIASRRPKIVGCTSMFQQTNAALALLAAVKHQSPQTITLMGGANCEGSMAEGIAIVGQGVDYIFEGESEESFTLFLQQWKSNRISLPRVIHGRPLANMNSLPTPSSSEYWSQLSFWLPDSPLHQPGKAFIGYETSRGCWWGEKSHCTFCGLNGNGMVYRAKDPDRVIAELSELILEKPGAPIAMADNIMPHSYFRTLLPRLATDLPQVVVFYEEKSNVNLERMATLAKANVQEVQFGIESLSTPLLQFMGKGVKAGSNIATLRYASAFGIQVQWNLLFGFPGDQLQWYEDMIEIFPLLHHLPPPSMATPVLISRFSPYHTQPAKHSIRSLWPLPAYANVFPKEAPVNLLAYHFLGDYPTASKEFGDLGTRLHSSVISWRRAWNRGSLGRPILRLSHAKRRFLLSDSRGLKGLPSELALEEAQAAALLRAATWNSDSEAHRWAVDKKLGLKLDGMFVPLIVASPELLSYFESTSRSVEALEQFSNTIPVWDLF